MRIPILSVITAFSLCMASSYGENENEQTEEVRWDEAETKKYTEVFWKQYDQSEVRKQLCIALDLAELVNKPEVEIPVSMSGPNFYRDKINGKVYALLSLGFTAHFRVDFESEKQTKGSFVDGVTGTWKSFATYKECSSFSSEWIDKKLESNENEKIIQDADEKGKPATSPESKSEASDKP